MTDQVELDLTVESGRPVVALADPDAAPTVADWLTERRPALRAALDICGALLIRGLTITSPADFAKARDALLANRAAYREKATPRSDYGDDVFSSTDLPPSQAIELHNENSYTLTFPGVLLFGCLVAPATGGATTVADCREVLAGLPTELVARFRRDGWILRRAFHAHMGLPWNTAFNTDDRRVAEKYCRDNLIAWHWGDGDALVTSQLRPATIHHPRTGEEVWFNHATFWNEYSLDPDVRDVLMSSYGPDGLPFATRHGDNSEIAEAEIAEMNAAYRAVRRREPWRAGDLLLVDNVLACHGRESYTGDRRIVVAMGEPVRVMDCRPHVLPAPGAVMG